MRFIYNNLTMYVFYGLKHSKGRIRDKITSIFFNKSWISITLFYFIVLSFNEHKIVNFVYTKFLVSKLYSP